MRIACLIPKSTCTHLEYVIIIALLLQQLLDERAHGTLHIGYIVLLVICGKEVYGSTVLPAGMEYAVRGYTDHVLSIFVQSVIAVCWTQEA
jgi:hypothetical protein